MGFDIVIDAGVNKLIAILKDGAGTSAFLGIHKDVLRSRFLRQNKQQHQ
jgi:hypothetical protein